MIIDTIENAHWYYGLGHGFEKALKFLGTEDLSTIALGRHEIQGDEIFALAMEYDTKPTAEGFWEAHRKYIDVQFIVTGAEKMGYANLHELKVSQEYDEEKDFLKLDGDGDFFTVPSGYFAIFGPDDAHMPSLAVCCPAHVRKVVVKVHV